MEIGARWMDGQHVRLPMSDEAFCARLLGRLESQLEWAARRCARTIVALHHVPFRELVPIFSEAAVVSDRQRDPKWSFTAPYMGSEALGNLLLRFPTVTHAYCGHTHFPLRTRRGWLECVNLGCTYLEKRWETVQ